MNRDSRIEAPVKQRWHYDEEERERRGTKGRSTDGIENSKLRNKANGRAKQRLIEAHRAEYERYQAEERHTLGLP